jgi:Uma2 family endonuclease
MTQSLPKIQFHTINEFFDSHPENSIYRYELHKGIIVPMPPPSGGHEAIIGFLTIFIAVALSQLGSQYRIPQRAFIKTPDADTLYNPDILIQDFSNVKNEPLWGKEPILCEAESVPLVVEVVSTNWQDDYYHKLADYEKMGIPEYWIIDFEGYGGKKFIGSPKVPTLFICNLQEGEYQMTLYRGNTPIKSLLFPNLNLTAQQIFDSVL